MTEILESIRGKICPSEQDEALLELLKQVTMLRHENASLKQRIIELEWSLEEKD